MPRDRISRCASKVRILLNLQSKPQVRNRKKSYVHINYSAALATVSCTNVGVLPRRNSFRLCKISSENLLMSFECSADENKYRCFKGIWKLTTRS